VAKKRAGNALREDAPVPEKGKDHVKIWKNAVVGEGGSLYRCHGTQSLRVYSPIRSPQEEEKAHIKLKEREKGKPQDVIRNPDRISPFLHEKKERLKKKIGRKRKRTLRCLIKSKSVCCWTWGGV